MDSKVRKTFIVGRTLVEAVYNKSMSETELFKIMLDDLEAQTNAELVAFTERKEELHWLLIRVKQELKQNEGHTLTIRSELKNIADERRKRQCTKD